MKPSRKIFRLFLFAGEVFILAGFLIFLTRNRIPVNSKFGLFSKGR